MLTDPPRLVFGQRLAEWRLISSRLQLLGTAEPWPFWTDQASRWRLPHLEDRQSTEHR
jgi:hypothetical protein